MPFFYVQDEQYNAIPWKACPVNKVNELGMAKSAYAHGLMTALLSDGVPYPTYKFLFEISIFVGRKSEAPSDIGKLAFVFHQAIKNGPQAVSSI